MNDIQVSYPSSMNNRKEVRRQMPRNNSKGQSRSNGSRRGFAAMDPEEQRQIASKGGRAAHEKGTAHEWDSREAKEAGRKGGES